MLAHVSPILAHLALCWLMLAPCWPILGPMLRLCWRYVRPSLWKDLQDAKFSFLDPSAEPKDNVIKGPDNPTSQLLPILSFKGCSGDGEGRKDKGGGERLCVKVCEKIVCM